jgi:hypothetical protein
MFTLRKLVEYFSDKLTHDDPKENEVKVIDVKSKPKPTAAKKKAVKIVAVTKESPAEDKKRPWFPLRHTCTSMEHDCVAIQLTNRVISMILEYEINMKRIQDHPSLSADTKSDIQNYINKNIITALWVLSPAFDLAEHYPRIRAFKSIYTKALNKGVPGILDEVKHI